MNNEMITVNMPIKVAHGQHVYLFPLVFRLRGYEAQEEAELDLTSVLSPLLVRSNSTTVRTTTRDIDAYGEPTGEYTVMIVGSKRYTFAQPPEIMNVGGANFERNIPKFISALVKERGINLEYCGFGKSLSNACTLIDLTEPLMNFVLIESDEYPVLASGIVMGHPILMVSRGIVKHSDHIMGARTILEDTFLQVAHRFNLSQMFIDQTYFLEFESVVEDREKEEAYRKNKYRTQLDGLVQKLNLMQYDMPSPYKNLINEVDSMDSTRLEVLCTDVDNMLRHALISVQVEQDKKRRKKQWEIDPEPRTQAVRDKNARTETSSRSRQRTAQSADDLYALATSAAVYSTFSSPSSSYDSPSSCDTGSSFSCDSSF